MPKWLKYILIAQFVPFIIFILGVVVLVMILLSPFFEDPRRHGCMDGFQ